MPPIDELLIKEELVSQKIVRIEEVANRVESDPDNKKNVALLRAMVEGLDELLERYPEIISKIVLIYRKQNADQAEVFQSKIAQFESSYYHIKAVVATAFPVEGSESYRPAPTSNTTAASSISGVALPKLKLNEFNGDLKSWQGFFDMFEGTIHHSVELSDVQKFMYLRSCLKGEALSLVSSLPLTSANYTVAWELLKSRYNVQSLLTNAYLEALLGSKSVERAPEQLRTFVTSVFEYTGALTALGYRVEDWAVLLLFLLRKKLSAELRERWEKEVLEKEMPTVKCFISFLEQEARVLEAAKCIPVKGGSSGFKQSAIQNEKKYKSYGAGTSTLVTTTDSGPSSASVKCVLCGSKHPLYLCGTFKSLSANERFRVAKDNHLCLSCLEFGHSVKTCRRQNPCRYCSFRHHSLLHFPPRSQSSGNEGKVSVKGETNAESVHVAQGESKGASITLTTPVEEIAESSEAQSAAMKFVVLLSTAQGRIRDRHGKYQRVKILIDSASQGTFITRACAQRLGLPIQKAGISIFGLAQTSVGVAQGRLTCVFEPTPKVGELEVEALVIENIARCPTLEVQRQQWPHLRGLRLADPSYYRPEAIDILLGAEWLGTLMIGNAVMGPKGTPSAIETVWGYCLVGKVPQSVDRLDSFSVTLESQLDCILRKFWEVEEIPGTQCLSEDDKECEAHFQATVSRLESGRYVVELPFRGDAPLLGNSRNGALGRFFQLERRLDKQPKLRQCYNAFMADYEAQGHMVKAAELPAIPTPFYIPHHCIHSGEDKLKKFRVVFDASMVTEDCPSLNQIVHSGPKLQLQIVDILLLFRMHDVVVIADIRQMYRNIRISEKHYDYQRVFWRASSELPLIEYNLTTVTYGVAAAPYLAIRTLQKLVEDEGEAYPAASQALRKATYMDDIVLSVRSLEEAVNLRDELIQLLALGGFSLRKWVSNFTEVLETIPSEHRAPPQDFFSFEDTSEGYVAKILGLIWRTTSDSLSFNIQYYPGPITKRVILSEISRLYDPLGFITPVIFVGKCILQRLWQLGIGWDETPPEDVSKIWKIFRRDMPMLSQFSLPRCLKFDSATNVQLHGFADSSERGYAGVVYARVIESNGEVVVSLVMTKSRVAPLKKITLPRLELCGALLTARLLSRLSKVFALPSLINSVNLWTDSMVAINWIRSSPDRWKTFVANRVSEIHELISPVGVRHVPSKQNPADCASRGLLPTELLNCSIWREGPRWLSDSESAWPSTKGIVDAQCQYLELREEIIVCNSRVLDVCEDMILNKFSSLSKLRRITALCLRFVFNCRNPKSRRHGAISTEELRTAMLTWIKRVQLQEFGKELTSLREGNITSRLSKLNPFIDAEGILRVGGRLIHSSLPYERKHPALLPSHHQFSNLLVDHFHEVYLHPGPLNLHAIIQRQFWILSARSLIRQRLRRCIKCFRTRPTVVQPEMGNLPAIIFQQIKPFNACGVDYGGPYEIILGRLRNARRYKAYVCLFVCLSTRALHLELASELTTEAFLAAFRRFIARRGQVSEIYSDCGTNFVGAKRKLEEWLKFTSSQEYRAKNGDYLVENGVKWTLIPPATPHFGGIWEARIKGTKRLLATVIGTQVLTYEEFYTVLSQIEATLNSRPLTPVSSNPDDLEALTPGHFLLQEQPELFLEPEVLSRTVTKVARWKLIQQIVRSFWKRWQNEFLGTLQQRTKWTKATPNLLEGKLVIVKDENLPPLRWRLGRVTKVHTGRDGVVRVAEVKTAQGYAGRTELPDNLKTMFRPVSMVVPDSCLIAEIILFGEGFKETRSLAKKVFTLYSLAMQQLSKQNHYDFGLRGMVALLRYAGRKRRSFPNFPDNEVVLLAMKDMNLAKLTSNDLPLFKGIISDLFPGVNIPVIDFEELSFSVTEELKQHGLQCIPSVITKVIQLYETKTSRHSVMIVGRTGSGKSVAWRILQKAMSRLGRENLSGFDFVKEYPINPKALSLGELYGEFNLSTGEWLDGVLSALMRKVCSDEISCEKWIVFDGPVDAVWIENMNSVMDDNKVLTLINSERIALPDQVSLLFEVDDLSEASPATVSRCGMVYHDYKDLGWKPYALSWLQKNHDKEYVEEMQRFMDRYISHILEFKRLNCKEIVPLTDISVVASLCKLLECFSTKENGMDTSLGDIFKPVARQWFLFCVVWSICASVDEDGRKKMDAYIRELEGMFPLKDTVYEYYVDPKRKSFLSWDTKLKDNFKFNLSSAFYKIIVPTVDTLRYQYLVSSLLNNGFPVLLVGPSGTGKTSIIQESLHSMDSDKYSLLTINMSAQTSSNAVQEIICSKLDKRSKGIYLPITGNKLIAFMDDLNMPTMEEYGAQPPLELIRQWIDYGFWYDREKQTPMFINDMLLMAAMGPSGGGRNMISRRLLSCFNVINMSFPSMSQIERIFGTMLHNKLNDFDDDVKPLGLPITYSTISLYYEVAEKMLPSPAKIHYLFSLRDISKIFQGLLRSHKEYQTTKNSFIRLWIHECYRVFCDRLIDARDREWFENQINTQLGEFFDLTFHGICPGKIPPIFGDFNNDLHIYEDILDFVALKKLVENYLNEYNSSPGIIQMDLVLFRDAIEHITRITRVISQPCGNMLLIGNGGSGRQSLARLSSFICEYELFQIEIRKQYKLQEFREDLKNLYRVTGVEAIGTTFIFSDSQIVDENFLEIINNILSSGEVPNLYKPEEFEELKNSIQTTTTEKDIGQSTTAIFDYFIECVRANLHIVLCMSPLGSAFRNWIRQYPGIVNCTTLDWYNRWPEDALLEVANKSLAKVKLSTSTIESEEILRASIATAFASIHHSVHRYSERMLLEMKRHNYVSAPNYLELVSGYIHFLKKKRKELSDSANKLRNGLLKIDETRVKIEVMSIELADAQIKVANFQQECDDYLVVIAQQKRETDEQQKSVAARSKKIMQEEAACKKLAEIAQTDLDEAMPALEEAMRALDALNKKDLSEIKSYGRPPAKVEMVMEAVMILKVVEPTWAEAKRQLGDPNFLTQLREFDKDNISDKTLKRISLYTSNEEFEPEKVGIVSTAAKSLCMWVRAIEKYGKIYRIVAPKRTKLQEATENLIEKQEILLEAQTKLNELSETLNRLKKDFDEKLENKEELRKKAEKLQTKLDRAALLVTGLSEEKNRWTQTVEFLDEKFKYLPGDCLIATAFVAYMGPFLSLYREELLHSWKENVKKLNVPHSPDLSVIGFLEDPTTVREWHIQGLPTDDFSTENGLIATRGNRWPLIIDPQSQALKWLQVMESAKGTLNIIDLQQPDFIKVLELAIQQGSSVLLKNVEEWLDPSLTPILNKSFVTQGGVLLLKMNVKMIQYNENFRFFITTKLRNPHFSPEISTKTTVINFAVKEQGLEAQLLGIVVRKERPELEEQKDSLVTNISAGKILLKNLEDEILRLLNEAEGSLLDDVHLINTLQTSKSTSFSVKEQLETSEKTEIEIDSARELYRPCALRASILFFVLNDMSRIDPMYQYSLDSYLHLFINSIEKSDRKTSLEERIESLNEYHTYAVYRNTCRGLFERHKLLFSFHMCAKIMEVKGEIVPAEYKFLLKGGVVLDRDEQMDNPCPGWLSDVSWDNITELDKLPGFHGVISSFEQYPREWQLWYIATEPENNPLIGQWGDICTEFQQMLFVRSLRPDRILFCVTSYIIKNIGPQFVEPPVLDLHAALDDSNAWCPLIFILSPGVDPTSALMQLSERVGMDKTVNTLSLGQGQVPIATNLIYTGMKEGNWVFLANCHLSLSWMPELDKIVEGIPNSNVNPRFRLWLSSSPHPDFPISILQSATKMTTEPPKGIKANMKRLYQLITDQQFESCTCPERYKKLLFSLCFFHSILLERKKFQQLGWNILYSFNDADFEISENLLSLYLSEYMDTPWDALKYLIAGINYGGHITDDWDRRLLNTYISHFFNDEAVNTHNYRLSSLPTYYIPRDGSLQSYRDYITILPNVDSSEVFGQHPNADIMSLINETRGLFDTLLSLQVQATDSTMDHEEDKVTQISSEVLSKLPEPIDSETCDKLTGKNKSPLDVVLLQEISRYNLLLTTIKSSLEELQKGMKGLVVMSSKLEEIHACMNDGRVPPEWLKAYPSLKLLGSWIQDLVQRVNHFAQWATTLREPVLLWLAAFTFPTALLTAVLQTSARQTGVPVDLWSWDFSVVTQDETLIVQGPDEGVYVRGLYLEGAGWDKKNLCLIDPSPMQLVCAMPVLHFKPVEQHKKKYKGIYVCPCYYYPDRSGGGSRPSFVLAVELKSGSKTSDHWIKRGTALLLSLA